MPPHLRQCPKIADQQLTGTIENPRRGTLPITQSSNQTKSNQQLAPDTLPEDLDIPYMQGEFNEDPDVSHTQGEFNRQRPFPTARPDIPTADPDISLAGEEYNDQDRSATAGPHPSPLNAYVSFHNWSQLFLFFSHLHVSPGS